MAQPFVHFLNAAIELSKKYVERFTSSVAEAAVDLQRGNRPVIPLNPR
jgi:hypothetical protein